MIKVMIASSLHRANLNTSKMKILKFLQQILSFYLQTSK